jgi:hypothetical protein
MVTRGRDASLAVSSRRSRCRSQRTTHMSRLVRLALMVGTAACAVAGIAPSVATADVARLEPAVKTKPGEPLSDDYRIVVTDQRGARRTLGPVPPGRLFAEPGGRHLLVVPFEDDDASVFPWIVPVDGSAIRPLRLPAGTMIDGGGFSQISWTPDGAEVLVGDVLGWPPAVARPSTSKHLDRCPIATAVCSQLPTGSGFAVGVPDGVLTTGSIFSSYPPAWWFDNLDEGDRPEWERPTSRRGRLWVRIANDVRVASTQLVGPPPKTLGSVRRTGAAGLPVAIAAVGGPGGAAISRVTFVTELERRRGKVRLNVRTRNPRVLLARPGAPMHAVVSRPIALSRSDGRRIHASAAIPGDRLHFHPRFATADGWIGGGSVESLVPHFAVLATMSSDGRVRPVTVRRRPATAWNLLRAALGRSPGRVAGAIEIVGYEAAGSAVVTVEHGFGMEGIAERSSTLRVPLDGNRRPTVIRGAVDVAW